MNISIEILLNGALTVTLIGVLWRVLLRVLSRLEEKMDRHIEERAACRAIMSSLIGRQEFNHAMERVYGRLDEQGERVAALEAAISKAK